MRVFSDYGFVPDATSLSGLVHNWREDAIAFVQHEWSELSSRFEFCGAVREKEEFTKQNIKTPGPGRLFVVDQNAPAPS